MIVSKWFESLDLPPMMQMLAKGLIFARMPGLMESDVAVQIDRDAGVVTVTLNGEAVLLKTFEEVEDYVNKSPDIHGPADPVAGGPGVGPAGIPRQDLN